MEEIDDLEDRGDRLERSIKDLEERAKTLRLKLAFLKERLEAKKERTESLVKYIKRMALILLVALSLVVLSFYLAH